MPSARFAAFTSSAPSGAPCASAVPAACGAPFAIVDSSRMSDGRSAGCRASATMRRMPSASYMLPEKVRQPKAW